MPPTLGSMNERTEHRTGSAAARSTATLDNLTANPAYAFNDHARVIAAFRAAQNEFQLDARASRWGGQRVAGTRTQMVQQGSDSIVPAGIGRSMQFRNFIVQLVGVRDASIVREDASRFANAGRPSRDVCVRWQFVAKLRARASSNTIGTSSAVMKRRRFGIGSICATMEILAREVRCGSAVKSTMEHHFIHS